MLHRRPSRLNRSGVRRVSHYLDTEGNLPIRPIAEMTAYDLWSLMHIDDQFRHTYCGQALYRPLQQGTLAQSEHALGLSDTQHSESCGLAGCQDHRSHPTFASLAKSEEASTGLPLRMSRTAPSSVGTQLTMLAGQAVCSSGVAPTRIGWQPTAKAAATS